MIVTTVSTVLQIIRIGNRLKKIGNRLFYANTILYIIYYTKIINDSCKNNVLGTAQVKQKKLRTSIIHKNKEFTLKFD